MPDEKIMYYTEPQIISGKGVMLSQFELKILAYLANHKLLTSRQLHMLHNSYKPIKSNSIRSKLWRWNKKGIVKTSNITKKKRFGNHHNLVRIEKNGLEILVKEKILPDEWLNKNIVRYDKIKNRDHYIGTQEIVLRTYLNISSKFNVNINSIRPTSYPYIDIVTGNELLKPDWIMKLDKNILNIEFETGNHSNLEVVNKIKNYATIAKQNPGKHYIVLVALMDNSIPSEFHYDVGDRKLANIKKGLMNNNDIHLPNLSIYITFLDRSYKISEESLLYQYDYLDLEIEEEINLFKEILTENKSFEYTIEEIADEDVYFPQTPKTLYANKVFKFSNYNRTHSENVLFVLMDEGNIKQLDKLNYLSESIKSNLFKIKIDKIIMYYSRKSDRINDIFEIDLNEKIYFADKETWLNEPNEEPKFYRQTGLTNMVVTSFDG